MIWSRSSFFVSFICPLFFITFSHAATHSWAASNAERIEVQRGSYRFFANDSIEGNETKTGYQISLTGSARVDGQGQIIMAELIRVDMTKDFKNITILRASGEVKLAQTRPDGGRWIAEGQNLIYRAETDRAELNGGIRLYSILAPRKSGGEANKDEKKYVLVSGKTAEVHITKQIATVKGDVRMMLNNPEKLVGPATFYGQELTVELDSGKWHLKGGNSRIKGNLMLKPKAGSNQ